jgi:hypothetical protein
MRAREFVTEGQQTRLPAYTRDPLEHAYFLPGVRNNDAYRTYRLGTAIARARAEKDPGSKNFPDWHPESAFGENAVVVGAEADVKDVVTRALEMTGYGGGLATVGSHKSHEPESVNQTSPVRPFRGYAR